MSRFAFAVISILLGFSNEFHGRYMLHVDGDGRPHSGIIAGESRDGEREYVQSDAQGVPDAS